MTLDQAIEEKMNQIQAFKVWYLEQNAKNPAHFPLELPSDNSGLWFEMIEDYGDEGLNYV